MAHTLTARWQTWLAVRLRRDARWAQGGGMLSETIRDWQERRRKGEQRTGGLSDRIWSLLRVVAIKEL